MKTISILATFVFVSSAALADNPPVAVPGVLHAVNFPPVVSPETNAEDVVYLVLAPNEFSATVVLDGSASYDPDGEPLQYLWGYFHLEDFIPLPGATWSSSPYLTYAFSGGTASGHFRLLVADAHETRMSRYELVVMTYSPATMMIELREWLDDNLGSRPGVQKVLIPTLNRAAQEFRDGEIQQAIETVKLFQRQAKTRLGQHHKQITQALVGLTQAVIDVVSAGQ